MTLSELNIQSTSVVTTCKNGKFTVDVAIATSQ